MSRLAFAVVAAALSLTLGAAGSDTPAADAAIKKAVEDLEKAAEAAETKADAAKFARAVAALKAVAGDQVDNELIPDFIDNTENYKGKTLTFRLKFADGSFPGTLRELSGGSALFSGTNRQGTAKLRMNILLPRVLDVPKARSGDELIVTFICEQGSNEKGNVAQKITRPK